MSDWSQERYLTAWRFAQRAHLGQKVPGTEISYLAHVGAVAMEVIAALTRRDDVGDPDLAVQCALLHDTVEDTDVEVADLAAQFGEDVAAGVAALSKDPAAGDKAAKMADSLARIRTQPAEVWMVKLADRITNLAKPPGHWSADKIERYRVEAETILEALGDACPLLSRRLADKIAAYPPDE